jgi:short-subunit dehydrogenase
VSGFEYSGKTALVTGASSGIGRVFAERLAARKVGRLILVARREEVLREVGETLGAPQVEVIALDLAVPGAWRQVVETVGAGSVDILVNNAGFATYGRLERQDPGTITEEIELNCLTLVGLARAFLPAMQSRRDGVIVNVGSTAGFQPLPYMSVYAATKAFVLSFSEALWAENRRSGVRVLALCPGATETAFFDRVGATEASVGTRQRPEEVVDVALRAVDRGRPVAISGLRNAMLATASRFAPRRVVATGASMTMRPNDAAAR